MKENQNVIGLKIKRLGKAMNQNFTERLRACCGEDITMISGRILCFLENSDSDIYQKDIEEKFHINRSSVTSVVKLMEKKEYISRIGVPNDARLKKLVITPKGRKICKAVNDAMRETETEALNALNDDEKRMFYSCCDKMIASIEKNGKEVEDFD